MLRFGKICTSNGPTDRITGFFIALFGRVFKFSTLSGFHTYTEEKI